MPEQIKLDQLLSEVLKYIPDATVDCQSDGNIVIVTNRKLGADQSTLESFDDIQDEED